LTWKNAREQWVKDIKTDLLKGPLSLAVLIRSRILPTTAKALIKPGGLLVQEVPLALGRKDDHVYIT